MPASSPPCLPVIGAILAGGASSRMGRPKEGVLLPSGRPMIEAVLSAMGDAFGDVLVSGICSGYDCAARPGTRHLHDEHPGQGPLAGLESLLACGAAEGYVVAACDQPLLTAALLRRLGQGAPGRARFFRTSEIRGERDPFPGYFPASWLERVRAALAAGRLSPRDLIRASSDTEWILVAHEEAARLVSVNTPEDLALLCGAPRERGGND